MTDVKRRPIGALLYRKKGEKAVKIGSVWPGRFRDGDNPSDDLSFNREDDAYGKAARPYIKAFLAGDGFIGIAYNGTPPGLVAPRDVDSSSSDSDDDDFGI